MRLQRYSIVIAISFFVAIGTAQSSQAGSITYSFSGVLGDCATPFIPGVCINDLSGHTVVGQFTADSAVSTLLAASFTVIGGSLTWGIQGPLPPPSGGADFISTISPTSLFIEESLVLPPPNFENFILSLNFNSPLTPSAGSTLESGYIERQGGVGFTNPFVSGTVDVVPEPSSVLLVATGLIGLFYIFGMPNVPRLRRARS